jgi:phosphoglycolate phosphatase
VANSKQFEAVFFDLDGTLIDTAPDMVATLVDIQRSEGRKPAEYEVARNYVSHGAAGLVKLGFPEVNGQEHERLRVEFLDRYESAVCVHSTLFPGLGSLLDDLDARGLPWGIVTNKPERMTRPLLQAMALDRRSVSTVCGDTIAERKPDPAPLLLACRQADVRPELAVYVGDAERDIEAGRRAGMATISANYGYIPDNEDPSDWKADDAARDPEELAQILRKAVTLPIL